MFLLIDNYDSFTYNLYHFLGELGATVEVRRNDALSVSEALARRPQCIVMSPGPCDHDRAGSGLSPQPRTTRRKASSSVSPGRTRPAMAPCAAIRPS